MLMASDLAREFHRVHARREFSNARELVADIDRFMASKGLAKSSISRVDVAEHVLHLQRQQAAVQSEVEAAWQLDQQQGIGDRRPELDEAALAAHVAGLDMRQYAAQRERLGVHQGLAAFLLGE
jgi:hypothetical protein